MTEPTQSEASRRFKSYLELLRRESDRGAVIVGASIIEGLLRDVLVARLVTSPESEDELLDGKYAPCSEFGSRIDLAHRVGSITRAVRDDLHLVRRMRNDAAHAGDHRDFQSQQVQGRLRLLLRREGGLLDVMRKLGSALADEGAQTSTEPNGSLDQFVDSLGERQSWHVYVAFLAVALWVVATVQRRIQDPLERARVRKGGA